MILNFIKLLILYSIPSLYAIDRTYEIKYLEEKFYYEKDNKITKNFKENQCLKFKKEGESFWKNYETDFFKIISTGNHSYKVKKINFPKNHEDLWYYDNDSEKNTIKFIDQNDFYLEECPKEINLISEKEIKKIKNKLK